MNRNDWEPKFWSAAGPEDYRLLPAGLKLHGEASYLAFNRRIVPELGESFGVRLPFLRKITINLRRNGQREAFWDKLAAGESFEERILAGMLLPELRPDNFAAVWTRIEKILARINNWAVCDTAAGALREWARRNAESVWEQLPETAVSPQLWTRRFGVVLMLHFQEPGDLDKAKKIFNLLRNEREYYVLMGMAWVASYYYFVEPDKLCDWLREFPNDTAVNLTIRKIVESRKANQEIKQTIKRFKR